MMFFSVSKEIQTPRYTPVLFVPEWNPWVTFVGWCVILVHTRESTRSLLYENIYINKLEPLIIVTENEDLNIK